MRILDNLKRNAVCSGILLVVSLIPILLLGRYNVMCIDDYNNGVRVHDIWMATGSLLQSMRTAWQQSMDVYQTWQGTYSSCFLMGMCPMNFRYESAWLVPVLMIGMFSVSTFVLGKHILHRWLGVEKAGGSFVMLVLLFMYYQVIEAPFEGIYWYNGATHYVLMQSFWFLTLTAVSTSLWIDKRSWEAVYCMIAVILAVIVGGGNLVTALQAEIMMALLVIYAAVTNRRKLIATVIPFVTGSIGFLINVMAPGNAQRGASYNGAGYSAVISILLSFYYAVAFVIRWTPAFVILIWLALLPILWKIVWHSQRTFRHPVWVTLGAFCVISAMFTPTLYAAGNVGLSRVDNIIQMVYYLCLLMVTTYWLGFISHRTDEETVGLTDSADNTSIRSLSAGNVFGIFLEKVGSRMTAVCLLLTLVMWMFTADKNTYTSISALRSLVYGEGRTFYAEAMERYDIYIDDTITEVEILPYSIKPALFDMEDLSKDPGHWLNLAVAEYFHKAYVKVVPQSRNYDVE